MHALLLFASAAHLIWKFFLKLKKFKFNSEEDQRNLFRFQTKNSMENSCYRPQASILVSISYLLHSISDYVERYAYLYPIHTDIDIELFQT